MPKKCHKTIPGPTKPAPKLVLKPSTLYVCIRKANSTFAYDPCIKGFMRPEDDWEAKPLDRDICRIWADDIVMVTGNIRHPREDSRNKSFYFGSDLTYVEVLHLPTNRLCWIRWRKTDFCQLKGVADKKKLKGYPKVV